MAHTRSGIISAALWVLCVATCCRGERDALREHRFSGATMGTTYTVKIIADALPADSEAETAREIEARLESVNSKMSTFLPESELSRFNHSAETTPFEMSEETLEVFRLARQISQASGGAFDITVGPLVNAWGFGPDGRPKEPPAPAQLAVMREWVGYDKLDIDTSASTVRKTLPRMYCDLSAIAKGYAVDRVAAALDRLGFRHYMVEVGGEVKTQGRNAQGVPWQIAVEKPSGPGRSGELVVPLTGRAMATSGDYRNYYEKDGVRLSHTIDPRTGRPISHKLASVSVIHTECALADGYATALMVLGPENGYSLADQLELAAFFIVRDKPGGFSHKATPAFDQLMNTAEISQ